MKPVETTNGNNSKSGADKEKGKGIAKAANGSRFVHVVIKKDDDGGKLGTAFVEPPCESIAELLVKFSSACGGFQGTVDPKSGAVIIRGWSAAVAKGVKKVASDHLGVCPPEVEWDKEAGGGDFHVFVTRKHAAAHQNAQKKEREAKAKELEKEKKEKEKQKEQKIKEKEKEKAKKEKAKKEANGAPAKKRGKKTDSANSSASSVGSAAHKVSMMEIDGEE